MLLFYDIECMAYDSLVVMKDINDSIVGVWWNSPPGDHPEDSPNGFEGIRGFIEGHTLVGYNNHHYDDIMLSAMMAGYSQQSLKKINDAIISGNEDAIRGDIRRAKRELITLDTIQQIDGQNIPSLKQIEGNMGRSIVESPIDFNIDRPLTESEKTTVLMYCAYDVSTTIAVYKLREKNYFQVKNALIAMLPARSKLKNPLSLNTTTLSADILLERPLPKWSTLRLPDKVRETPDVPDKVWEMWTAAEMTNDRESKEQKVTIKNYDCEITFASGGLHGVALKGKEFRGVKLLDVGSMYPSIIVNLEALGPGTEGYNQMRMERLLLKKTDKVRADAFKIVLNSVYGNLKNQYSILNNPLASLSVCAYGQLALYDLSRRLYEAGYTLVNLNTDGVAFVDYTGAGNRWEDIQRGWEAYYNLSLELDEFDRWIQRDVNCYVAVGKDGHIKTKGGDCKLFSSDNLFGNNNARILQIALVEQLLHDVPVWKTIKAHRDEPNLFQYILKAGRTYLGVVDGEGRKHQNVNRVFATAGEGIKLYKQRADGGLVNFPDAPETMFLWNGELSKIPDFRKVVDLGHYIEKTDKNLERWREQCM